MTQLRLDEMGAHPQPEPVLCRLRVGLFALFLAQRPAHAAPAIAGGAGDGGDGRAGGVDLVPPDAQRAADPAVDRPVPVSSGAVRLRLPRDARAAASAGV